MGDTRRGVGASAHVCRVVDDRPAFVSAALAFLADGLAGGMRVCYIGEGDDAALRAELAPLRSSPQFDRPGAVVVWSTSGAAPVVDVAAQVQVSIDATAAALADGFTGFRTAGDCTPFAGSVEQLDALGRLEHRLDRLATTMPFSAFCAVRRDVLDDHTISQLACLHPAGATEHAPFRLHAAAGADAALSGELDVATVDLFASALERAGLHDTAADVVIDARHLDFADHRNLLLLEQLGHRRDRAVVLRSDRHLLRRLVAALGMTRVRVEPAA